MNTRIPSSGLVQAIPVRIRLGPSVKPVQLLNECMLFKFRMAGPEPMLALVTSAL